jgi:hypothetical protein
MPKIEIIDAGHVDRSDSAFPTTVLLDNGDILCGFSVGGGAHVDGGTFCARSSDGGCTWSDKTPILEATDNPCTINHLRLSRERDGAILAYGQRDQRTSDGEQQRLEHCEAIVCTSQDGGHTWSPAAAVPLPIPGPYEISNPIVVTEDGRWLAPTASHHNGRYGEQVILLESADRGATWSNTYTVFEHPQHEVGYLEQKVSTCGGDRLIATAWCQDYKKDTDLFNAYAFSTDGGRTWNGPHDTGIQGQTMTPVWLGDDRFLVIYNHRFGHQCVQMLLVRANSDHWDVEFEGMMYDGQSTLELTDDVSSQEQIRLIKFGYPTALRLNDSTFLATHWCEEDGVCGIRWTLLHVG